MTIQICAQATPTAHRGPAARDRLHRATQSAQGLANERGWTLYICEGREEDPRGFLRPIFRIVRPRDLDSAVSIGGLAKVEWSSG